MEVKVEVKMDNTFCDNTFVPFNSLFYSPFNSPFNSLLKLTIEQ